MRINQIQLFLFMGYDNPFIAIEQRKYISKSFNGLAFRLSILAIDFYKFSDQRKI